MAQAMDWIKTLTPVIVLAVGGVMGWVKLSEQVSHNVRALEAECSRSKATDQTLGENQRKLQLSAVKMESDISYIKQAVTEIKASNNELLRELRNQ